jgi:hypothetical protein
MESDMAARSKICHDAGDLLVGERNTDYGDPSDMHDRAAEIFTAMTDRQVSGLMVAQMLIAVKLARLHHQPTHRDSWVDLCGYAGIGYEIAIREKVQ